MAEVPPPPPPMETVEAVPRTIPDRWIVSLRAHATNDVQTSHMATLSSRTADPTSFHCNVHHKYELNECRGYSASFNDATKEEIEQLHDVLAVEPVQFYNHCATQTNAPWGLARIAQPEKLTQGQSYGYTYNDDAAGSGVVCYVLDTGINAEHVEFEGRASRGPKFVSTVPGTSDDDVQGHGTHCAGTIASRAYGVAKKTEVIGVKVFNDLPEGNPSAGGTNEDIMAALQYVVDEYKKHGRPTVVNMSLGGGPSDALDNMVTSAVRAGIVCCVAAGNAGADRIPKDASTGSPARVPLAITVGATNIQDELAWFSFYGKMVDILAPGVDILSTWCGGNQATNTISGTSMATPHVAGAACCLLSDPKWEDKSAFNIMSQILILADKNKTSGITDQKLKTVNAVLQVNDN